MRRGNLRCSAVIAAMLLAASASAQTGSPGQTGSPPSGPQTEKPQSPETAPARPANATSGPLPQLAVIGPSREIKLGDYTWFRFGAQVQAWYRAAQDRSTLANTTGSYASDFYCRRCRFFATGSVVENVYFNVLFEAGNYGRGDAATGLKQFGTSTVGGIAGVGINPPVILDAYGQVKLANWLWISGGNILMPLTRNGTQPTTTYLSIDNANVDVTPVAQGGNSLVLRDLGFQLNGYFIDSHLEYRVGVFQGNRQPAIVTGTPPVTTETASHNGPRFVSYLLLNFWDPEVGYVNGGHYYGTKRVLGVMGNFDYQQFRTDGPALAPPAGIPATGTGVGVDKNAYYGISGAAFINYPLAGAPTRTGGDELVGLVQFGYYDGGLRQGTTGAVSNFGTYPSVFKQTNYLVEAAYYAHKARFSVFGKWERRQVADDYTQGVKAAVNQNWAAAGLKYYVGPANTMNFGLQYERITNYSAPSSQQGGTNNLIFQMQTILY